MVSEILSPEGAILTDPGQVEFALAEMWKEAGEAAGGEAHRAAATRVCVANLVVVAAKEQWNGVLEVLGELAPMYPTRTIALLMSEQAVRPVCSQFDRQNAGPTRETVHASVTTLCHVPQPGQPQVCCEQIVLHATHAQSADLHRTVLPLLEADVPVMVWWTLPARACNELLHGLARMARRFILDAGIEGVAFVPQLPYPQVREFGWYRIHRWRELVAGMFDECGPEPLSSVDEVCVEIGAGESTLPESAVWLIAFLGGQLGWTLRNAECGVRNERAASTSHELATFEFAAVDRPVRASIVRGSGEGLIGLTIRSGSNVFEARRGVEELRIIVHDEHVCRVPRVVHLPRRKVSEALATALAGRAVDAAFMRAAPLAAGMARGLVEGSLPPHS